MLISAVGWDVFPQPFSVHLLEFAHLQSAGFLACLSIYMFSCSPLLFTLWFLLLSLPPVRAAAHLAQPRSNSVLVSCSSQTANERGHKTCAQRKFLTASHQNISDLLLWFCFCFVLFFFPVKKKKKKKEVLFSLLIVLTAMKYHKNIRLKGYNGWKQCSL